MRCPSCGARNADSAEWCTQCYAPLRAPSAPDPAPPTTPDAVPGTRPEPGPTAAAPAATDARAQDAAATTTADDRFRRTAEGIDWRCEVCDTWNPIERTTCVTCQAPFARTIAPPEETPRPEVNELAVVAASLALPGAGHVMLQRTGAGVLRMILYVTWLVGGIALLRAAVTAEQSALPAVPLLLGAFVILGASVVEAQQATEDRDLTILTPRVILWLVVGVLGLLTVTFLAATMAATS